MSDLIGILPLTAAVLAVPQFAPQLLRLGRTSNAAGVSWSWAALTCVNNGAWIVYFAMSRLWTALIPAISATVLAGALTVALARRSTVPTRPAVLCAAWATVLAPSAALFGLTGIGTALTVAFVLQVTPSVRAAFHAPDTTGISAGTWLLIFGELLCWGVFGVAESDPRLALLGSTGVVASLLVLGRLAAVRRRLAMIAST